MQDWRSLPDHTSVSPRSEPPPGVSAAEFSAWMLWGTAPRASAVVLTQMVVDGHIRVARIEYPAGFRGRLERAWRLHRTDASRDDLPAARSAFLDAFFGDRPSVFIHDRRKDLGSLLDPVGSDLEQRVSERGWTVSTWKRVVGIPIPRRELTRAGRAVAHDSAAFQAYLLSDPVGDLTGPDGVTRYLAYVPWALALGCADEWAVSFARAQHHRRAVDMTSFAYWTGQVADADPHEPWPLGLLARDGVCNTGHAWIDIGDAYPLFADPTMDLATALCSAAAQPPA